jgi:hypothetical protein
VIKAALRSEARRALLLICTGRSPYPSRDRLSSSLEVDTLRDFAEQFIGLPFFFLNRFKDCCVLG